MGDVVERLQDGGYRAPPDAEREQLVAYWEQMERLRAALNERALGQSEPSTTYESWRAADD